MKAIRRYLKYFVIQITKTNLKLSYSSENPQNIMHIFKILLKPCVMFCYLCQGGRQSKPGPQFPSLR